MKDFIAQEIFMCFSPLSHTEKYTWDGTIIKWSLFYWAFEDKIKIKWHMYVAMVTVLLTVS